MLLLQRQRKAVDDRAQDLEQLRDAVVVVALVDEAVEGVVDGAPDEGAVRHELAVHPVQDRLEVVPLARILRVEQLQHRDDRGLVDVSLRHLRVDIARDDEAEEELVDELQVGPRRLQEGLVLLRVKVRVEVALPWGERSEQVCFDLQRSTRQMSLTSPHVKPPAVLGRGGRGAHHFDRVLVHRLRDRLLDVHKIDQLQERLPLILLGLRLRLHTEVVDHGAHGELLLEELRPLRLRHICARVPAGQREASKGAAAFANRFGESGLARTLGFRMASGTYP